jgi:hypothetical protein
MFDLADEELIGVGKALSHPTRLAMVRDLRSGVDARSPTTRAEARRIDSQTDRNCRGLC